MIIFDFEVFEYDWLVVFYNMITEQETIIINNRHELDKFINDNKNELFIGFNNSRYDNYILKGILLDLDPFHITRIIIEDKNMNRIYKMTNWNLINLNTYDVSFNVGFTSLKENEAYLGISIDECPINFKLGRPLTDKELELVIDYCKRDVNATTILFKQTVNTYETKLNIISTFDLDKSFINKSDQQIIANILGANRQGRYFDELDGFDFSQLNLKINKYQPIINHFKKQISEDYKSIAYEYPIAGISHAFGIGGIHGAVPQFEYVGEIWILDVQSYYPTMMIEYDWFARSIPDEKKKLYSQMKADRVVLKKTNKKLSDAYKLVLNTTYGCYKFKWSELLDPRMANNICIGGQVMIVDLLEQIEPYCKLIQSNTDGIIIIPYNKEKIKEEVRDWEERTRMIIELEIGKKIFQKDVNNYVMEFEDGYIKAVGGYVRQYNGGLRRTLSIVDKALVEHLIHGKSIEEYISSNDDPLDYQIISKVGNTYDRVFWSNDKKEIELHKVNRAFAGYDYGRLYKQKKNKNRELVASHPEKCFIFNDDLLELDISKINKQWYVDLTYARLNDYRGIK